MRLMPTAGLSLGPLRNQTATPIHIDGPWGTHFGDDFANQPVNTLFFASGPDDESHGLYERLDLIDHPGSHGTRGVTKKARLRGPLLIAGVIGTKY